MIGRCESQTGDFGVFMRPLTAGSLLGVPNLSSANTTTAGKKNAMFVFFYLRVQIMAISGFPVLL